jgi:hypothetical protein
LSEDPSACSICERSKSGRQADGQQGAIVSAPAVANGLVYVSENNGMVVVFNAKGCGKSLCLPLTQLLTHNEPIVSSSPDLYTCR